MTKDTPEGGDSDGRPRRRGSKSGSRRRGRRSRRRSSGGASPDQPDKSRAEAPRDGSASASADANKGTSDEGKRSRSRRRRRRKPGSSSGKKPKSDDQGPAQETAAPPPRRRRSKPSRPTLEPEEPDQLEERRPLRPEEFQFLRPTNTEIALLTADEPDYDWPDHEQLVNVVAVRFTQGGVIEEFDAADSIYDRGDQVIVETDKGLQLGEVVVASRRLMRTPSKINRVIRKMTPNDTRQERRNQDKVDEAFALCQQLANQYKLAMKVIGVDYLHGGNRAIFYFSAEGRVDFRQLVRELASQLHTRIEMRQVGVRDASRHVGGIGPCGQQLCCSSFLQRFAPVSIRMAKDQNLVLNPQKVSGVCGRLMCCLTYEQKGYEALRKGLPKAGKRVQLVDGRAAKIRDVDVLHRQLRVQLEDGSFIVVEADQIAPRSSKGGSQGPDKGKKKSKESSK